MFSFLKGIMARIKLNAPSNLVANGLNINSIQLHWVSNSSGAEKKFQVERSLFPNRRFNRIARLPRNTTNYTDVGLEPDITYYYRIKALA